MWHPATRRRHSRGHLRYGGDLTDAEWEIVEPVMPGPAKTGRPREWSTREIITDIFHVLRAGCAWRMPPKDFPPMTTVYSWFLRLRREGLFEMMAAEPRLSATAVQTVGSMGRDGLALAVVDL